MKSQSSTRGPRVLRGNTSLSQSVSNRREEVMRDGIRLR